MAAKNNNPTIYLLITFLVLLIAAVFLKNNPFRQEPPPALLLPELVKEAVTKINLNSAEENLTLEKSGEDWILLADSEEATKAAAAKIDSFLAVITGLDKSDLISQNEAKLTDFELTEDTASIIELWQGENSIKLLVGKRSADFIGNYIRVQKDNNVYKSTSPLSSYFLATAFNQ